MKVQDIGDDELDEMEKEVPHEQREKKGNAILPPLHGAASSPFSGAENFATEASNNFGAIQTGAMNSFASGFANLSAVGNSITGQAANAQRQAAYQVDNIVGDVAQLASSVQSSVNSGMEQLQHQTMAGVDAAANQTGTLLDANGKYPQVTTLPSQSKNETAANSGSDSSSGAAQPRRNSTQWQPVHESIEHGTLFAMTKESLPERYQLSLKKAISSGDWNITKLMLDKIHLAMPDQKLGNFILEGDLTILEYCGNTGHAELYDFLVQHNYAPDDRDRKNNAHQLLISAATTSAEDKAEASLLQLIITMSMISSMRNKHTMTARYYGARHMWFFFLPGATLSAVSGLLAFLSTSVLAANFVGMLGVIVGILATCSTLIQTIGDQLDYSSRSVQHGSASRELEGLLQNLTFSTIDSVGGKNLPMSEKDLQTIKKQVTSIELTCRSAFPTFLDCAYEVILQELRMYRRQATEVLDDDAMLRLEWELFNDVTLITEEIANMKTWPWYLDMEKLRQQVLRRLTAQVREMAGGKSINDSDLYVALKQFEKVRNDITLSQK